MSTTYQASVQSYTGTLTDTQNLTNTLTAGARIIVDGIPEDKLDKYTTNYTDAGSGVDISAIRVVRSHKGGYRANRVDPGLKTQVLPSGSLSTIAIVNGGSGYSLNDVLTLSQGTSGTCTVTGILAGVVTSIEITTAGSSFTQGVKTTTVAPSGGTNCTLYVIPSNGSIHEATTTDPVYYIENSKGYVVPLGGTIIGVPYPSVAYNDDPATKPTNFPLELTQGIVLYSVIQVLLAKSNTILSSLDALSLDTITAPSAPSDASYSYTNATLGTYTATTIGTLPTAPIYTSPTCTLTTPPSDLSISTVPPTPPSAPSLTYTDAVIGTYTPTTIDALPTSPTYTAPTCSLTTAPSDLTISITPPTPPTTPSYSYTDAILGTYTATTIGTTSIPTAFSKPTTSFSLTNATTYIQTDEDSAKAGAELQMQSEDLQKYSNDLQNELSRFNSDYQVYQQVVQVAIEQARLDQQRLIDVAQKTTDLSLQNKAKALEAAIQLYQSILQKYQEDISQYVASINTQVSTYSANLQKWTTDRQTQISKYGEDIQNALNTFNADVVVYNAGVQRILEQARLTQEEILAEANKTTDLNIQNSLEGLAQQVQQYQAILGKYSTDINLYTQTVNTQVEVYSNNLQKWTTDRQTQLGQYSNDIQNALNLFNQDVVAYNAGVQKLIEQARLDQDRLMKAADKTTDLSIVNQAKALEVQIQQYQSILGNYSGKINSYQTDVNKITQKYSISVQKYSNEVQGNNQLIEECRKEFQTIMSSI